DALSRLILKRPKTISELLNIQTFEQLLNFCLTHWENKELQEDDISAIIIPIAKMRQINYILPPSDFSFPKEKEEEFIPTSLTQNNQINFTAMEMNEIRNRFNGVAQDFYQIKKKLKIQELLLMIAISLLILNILFVYFFRPISSKKEIPNEK